MPRLTLVVVLLLGAVAHAEDKRPAKIWNRTGYHVYGLEWGKDEIKYFVDGIVVRTVENTHWHQPLYLTFDSETMPEWFGMPKDEDLPSTFSIEYVRAWKKAAQ